MTRSPTNGGALPEMTAPSPDRVCLHLASRLESAATVEQLAETFALRAGFNEDTSSAIALVSREATVNAVLHGNRYDPEKAVDVTIELTENELSLQIADQGAGFDPEHIPDPLAAENLLRTSGRGVFLMRAIMDEVHFRKLVPGTEITLRKHRNKGETRKHMDIKIRHAEGITILDLAGKITMGEGSGQLRSAIQDALAAGSKKILMNLGDVSYIDSAGLGELVGGYTTVKNAGGQMKLLNLSKKVKDLLVITKLLTVFDVSEDEKAALASFS